MPNSEKLINGSFLASQILSSIKKKHLENKDFSPQPSLAIIQVGKKDASSIYIRRKIQACNEVGFKAHCINLPDSSTQADLVTTIKTLNQDTNTHGILLQLPLPKHLNGPALLAAIDPKKDVDAIGPTSLGNLMSKNNAILPCTTAGILTAIESTNIMLAGKQVTMVGSSTLVGKPTTI